MKKVMKNKKNQILVITLFSVIVLSIGIGFVYASLTHNQDVSNDFKIANEGGTIEEIFTPPSIVTPGTSYKKEVKVTNIEETPIFIRVSILPEITIKDGEEVQVLPSEINKQISLIVSNTDKWLQGEDGYFYYLDKLDVGDSTPNLIDSISLDSNLEDSYNGASLKIYIKSEAIIGIGNHYRDTWWDGVEPIEPLLLQIDKSLQTALKEAN